MAAATCQHDCARCRAIEAGLGEWVEEGGVRRWQGRPLTWEQSVRHGGLISPEPAANGWAGDTIEAALAVDEAEAAYEEAEHAFSAAYGVFLKARSDGVHADVDGTPIRGERAAKRLGELDQAVKAAQADHDEAGERLVAARVAHAALVRRDEQARRLENDRAVAAAEEEQKRERAKAKKRRLAAGRKTLAEILGRAKAA